MDSHLSPTFNGRISICSHAGAGKTEVSKQIMQYIAAVSGNGAGVERVKNVIIEARRGVQSERWQNRNKQSIYDPRKVPPQMF